MNNLKKTITLLLSLSIVLMLSACSGKIKDSDVIGNWQVQSGIILSSEAKVLEIYKGGTARAYLDSERNRRYELPGQ